MENFVLIFYGWGVNTWSGVLFTDEPYRGYFCIIFSKDR
jgi:hypothetical protein